MMLSSDPGIDLVTDTILTTMEALERHAQPVR
jgi:hypothetical protein